MSSIENLKEQALAELTEHILPFWINRVSDPEGGFYGRIDGNGILHKESPRGGVLNARILWTFSSAYRITGKPEYLDMALKAKAEIASRFYDPEYGGTYWSIDCKGNPEDTKKQIYAIAFTIYGLAELYRATEDAEALELAKKLYHSIEKSSFDVVNGGYYEAFARNWGELADLRLSEKEQNVAKTMNTHLHVLEAYTALYRIWKDEELQSRLESLIHNFLERILMPSGHQALFFNADWSVTSDDISYGHDIECSWLLAEAAEVLGDQALLAKVKDACALTAKAAVEGLDADGGLCYELKGDGALDSEKHWWVQAEMVVGAVWQWKYTHDAEWLEKATATLEFIKKNLISPEGEWYWSLKPDGSINKVDDLAGPWKCPYHNSRMCMEILERL